MPGFLYKFGDPPCRNCDKRTIDCHGKCEPYNTWRKKEQKWKAERRLKEGIPPLHRFYEH